MPLLLQATAIVVRDAFVPPQLTADAQRFGARILPGVPFMFQYFATNPPPGGWPPGLRWLISAGAPLPPSTVRAFHDRFGVKIHSFYGTTETGGIAFDDDDEIREEPVVGRALPGVTITLQPDEHAPDNAGRIHVRSAAVAGGYSDDTRDGFDEHGFLTGDYGAWDARQRLTLRGRVSAFVNVAGRKVQPEEVEQVLRAMPGVADVRVLAAPDAAPRPADCRVHRRGRRRRQDQHAGRASVLRRAPRGAQDSADDPLSQRDAADSSRENGSSRAGGSRARAPRRRGLRLVIYSRASIASHSPHT